MTISYSDALFEITMIRHHQETIDLYVKDFKDVTDEQTRHQVDGIIRDSEQSLVTHQEDLFKTLGFSVKTDLQSLSILEDRLKELQDAEQELSDMSDAWESGDACSMACNDPGLQFEQSMDNERLLSAFIADYNKDNKND